MMQRVLPDAQVAAQAGKAKKVDPNPLPPPGQVSPSLPGGEDVCDGLLVTDEAPHHQPPYTVQVFPSLPGGDDVCDGQVVTDEQGGIVIKCFPPLSYPDIYPKEVFPSTVAFLLFTSWQTSPSYSFTGPVHTLPHEPAPHSPAAPVHS